MSSDRFSDKARRVIRAAFTAASALRHPEVKPAHLLVGLFAVPEEVPAQVLTGFGLTETLATSRLRNRTPVTDPGQPTGRRGAMPTAATTRQVLANAYELAAEEGRAEATVTDLARVLLVTCIHDPDLVDLLQAVDTNAKNVRSAIEAADPAVAVAENHAAHGDDGDAEDDEEYAPVGGNHPALTQATAPGTYLERFGTDLLQAAQAGAFDPLTGRTAEIARAATILARRTKNNPVFVGPPGVGKTALAEGLAQAIVNGDAPPTLAGRPLIALDLAGMVAGSRMRGDFEERLGKVMAEAAACNAILFIDEIHQLLGAGSSSGTHDAANLIKPHITRGDISILGATTDEEYRKHIEADPALERRFQPVKVAPPSVTDTVAILSSLAPAYAAHHGVTYTPEALAAAAKLTDRYVTDRHLPDKAIDVLDEAGAAAAVKLMHLDPEVRDMYTARARLRAQDTPDPDLDAAMTADIVAATGTDLCTIDAQDIAAVVAAATGIPVTTMTESEVVRLRTMSDRLRAKVIGQDEAVDRVAKAVARNRVGLSSGTRPTSFIFAGPTGVGKSELAKALDADLFATGNRNRTLLQFDMSEYAEKHSVSRLFGAAPGYVGHEEGGQLTNAVRRSPYAVILLDEVEKAHPDVFDALLQVLEDGRMTDGTGRTVNFANTVIIMTTNLGAGVAKTSVLGFGTAATAADKSEETTLRALREHFRPEFLNRVDDIVVFRPLDRVDLEQIVTLLLEPTVEQLAERGITVTLTPAAVGAILNAGFDPAMGARPARRAITTMVTDPLSDALLAGTITAGDQVVLDAPEGHRGTQPLTVTGHEPQPVTAQPVPAGVTA